MYVISLKDTQETVDQVLSWWQCDIDLGWINCYRGKLGTTSRGVILVDKDKDKLAILEPEDNLDMLKRTYNEEWTRIIPVEEVTK